MKDGKLEIHAIVVYNYDDCLRCCVHYYATSCIDSHHKKIFKVVLGLMQSWVWQTTPIKNYGYANEPVAQYNINVHCLYCKILLQVLKNVQGNC